MKRQLPSFPSIRAFEAAARLQSFKAAADELSLTQSAISHQVKNLEEFLAAPLFIRHPHCVELTLRGQEYLALVTHMLDELDQGTRNIRSSKQNARLNIQASPAFCSHWLLPRLIRFNKLNPNIEVDVSLIEDPLNPKATGFDVRFNCVWEVPPDSGAEPFMRSQHLPVCSSSLLENGPTVASIDDLFRYPIVRAQPSWDPWPYWIEEVGYEGQLPEVSNRFENTFLAITAAEQGLGIAMGPIALISEKVAVGQLVVPLHIKAKRGLYYTLNCVEGWQQQPEIVAFRTWLHQELGESSAMEIDMEWSAVSSDG